MDKGSNRTIFSFFLVLVTLAVGGLVGRAGASSNCPKNGLSLQGNFTKQYIYSPGYPGNYPRPSSCKWTIEAVQGDIIVFRFYLFDIEASIFCYKDIFSIIDGHTGFHYELLSMCGSYDRPTLLRTSEPMAIVQFQAVTSGDAKPGFVIAFWTESNLNIKFKDAELTWIHYSLAGVSAVLGLTMAGLMVVLYRVQIHKDARKVEQDQALTWARIDHCYFSTSSSPSPATTNGVLEGKNNKE